MSKIAVVGDRDSIYGFAALGLEVIFAEGAADERAKQLRRLAEGDYAVIYLTEWLAEEQVVEISKYKEKLTPAFIPLPGLSGNTGIGMQMVKQSVERAVGSDIVFNEK